MSNNGHPLLVLLVCLLKSFKELFIYQTLTKGHPLLSGEPLFSEASAKVRTFSEPRKSFREKFSNLTHFPAVVDGGQGHIRHTHYYILYRRRGKWSGMGGRKCQACSAHQIICMCLLLVCGIIIRIPRNHIFI